MESAVMLGRGGEMPSESRETSAVLLRDGERAILVDAGTGTRRPVTDANLLASACRLDVLLTHFYMDHVCGLVYLNMLDLPFAV